MALCILSALSVSREFAEGDDVVAVVRARGPPPAAVRSAHLCGIFNTGGALVPSYVGVPGADQAKSRSMRSKPPRARDRTRQGACQRSEAALDRRDHRRRASSRRVMIGA